MLATFLNRTYDRAIWSVQGLSDTWIGEMSFRYWVVANVFSAVGAFLLPLSAGERGLLLALGVLVLAAELFNTAIERVVDLVTQERHELARQAKDAGSAAVMMTAAAAAVAWMVILSVWWTG